MSDFCLRFSHLCVCFSTICSFPVCYTLSSRCSWCLVCGLYANKAVNPKWLSALAGKLPSVLHRLLSYQKSIFIIFPTLSVNSLVNYVFFLVFIYLRFIYTAVCLYFSSFKSWCTPWCSKQSSVCMPVCVLPRTRMWNKSKVEPRIQPFKPPHDWLDFFADCRWYNFSHPSEASKADKCTWKWDTSAPKWLTELPYGKEEILSLFPLV